ncbi:MAG: GNAT family N-acetyltransferase [Anaerolineae bacterium]
MDLKLERLSHLDAADTELLRTIYFDSFPPSEREDFGGLVERFAEGVPWLYLGRVGTDIVGFAVVIPLVDARALLLDYFAIAREWRSRGVGSRFLRQLADLLQQGEMTGIVLEVESDEWGPEAERDLRRRRIGFYRRHGLDFLPGVPALSVPSMDDDSLLETKLMWLPLRPAPPHAPALVAAVYRYAYGLPPEHELVQQALRAVRCLTPLPLPPPPDAAAH